jgi:hypothetical protein
MRFDQSSMRRGVWCTGGVQRAAGVMTRRMYVSVRCVLYAVSCKVQSLQLLWSVVQLPVSRSCELKGSADVVPNVHWLCIG